MSIAVLPFVDMSPERDQEYLGDGIAEEILNLLAQVQGLTVIARTSSFSFKGEKADIGTIARRLNVAHVLEGSVRKAGERLRITAQLVDGASGAHLWSQTFDERMRDIFATQDAIARNVATILQERLLGVAETGPVYDSAPVKVVDPQAWEAYLRGKYFYGRRKQGDILRAQQHFEQALALDPGLAVAWVALAATYNVRMGDAAPPDAEHMPPEAATPLMKAALGKALALDPRNPEALLRMSWFTAREGDMEGAIDQMEQAMRGGRNHALVQSMLGGLAFMIGDAPAAAELQRRAVMLDPVSATHQANLGHMMYAAGRLEEADLALGRAEELNAERAADSRPVRVWIAIHQENFALAAERAAQLPPGPDRDQAEALLAFQSGDSAAADAALARLLQSPDPAVAVRLACVYAFRGEPDASFLWIEHAAENLSSHEEGWRNRHAFAEFSASPFLRPLHGDPRWTAWLAETRQRLYRKEHERIAAMLQTYLKELAAE
jgi:TolB-like protein/Tfp pilus assembly protein PilF